MNSKEYAVIVAGGKGRRFGSNVPKQFVELNGKPVLMHTIDAFDQYKKGISIILVLPEEDFPVWKSLCTTYKFEREIVVVPGGSSRFQSVRNGLAAISGDGLVAIHDGVRPLITPDIIATSFQAAATHGAAIAAVDMKESLREVDANGSQAVDRSRYKLIQTPQTFKVFVVKEAYETDEDPTLTDDASVVEKSGYKIFLFEGSYENIKITTASDLILAQALLQSRQNG